MTPNLVYIVAALGGISLLGVFFRMKTGFGPTNLRVVGLVLIATFAALFAAVDPAVVSATMGIFGGITGYLFGMREKTPVRRTSVSGFWGRARRADRHRGSGARGATPTNADADSALVRWRGC